MMKIVIKSFVFLLLISSLSKASVFAKISVNSSVSKTLITSPPTVYSPVTYWQNCTTPLVAIPSVGATLNWYLTNAPTEIPTAVAPIPNTTIIGTAIATYYVSQTIAGVESIRVPIVVNVAVDNGAAILGLRCDASQIPNYSSGYTPPATINNSVFFDWGNNSLISNSYNFSYTIQGGAPVIGTTGTSHWLVPNMLPGQSATLILTSASHPCVPSQTMKCSVPCGSSTTTPTFTSTPTTYCLNDVVVLPTTSTNGITGAWSPSSVDTSSMGTITYTFTPDPIVFPCALKTTLSISVEPIEPDFSDFSICSGDVAPVLSSVSPNGITGSWNPATVDNLADGAYVFTPDPGQACTPSVKIINVTVNPSNTINTLNWTTTDDFTKIQIVTVTDPLGANFVYQMDDGPLQTSTIFEKVSPGLHSITVKDVNGCSALTNNNVLIIGYSKYFTPNGDTYNDSWNINTLSDLSPNSRIYIFDRYGKLLKDISPGGSGWDGTYLGRPMPADDYWFTVEYSEQNSVKKYKSHFSLKR
ncbi:T9SS type B sorting domain-containing protein [Flavobacterium nackdongense]|uniref:T9SS type B sorting domain-containing protein n=1 Tax=Flavobacterium nackdongense TaxID=2547394 RepID=A0A4P6YAD4_9FLAO|nr:T9SS type B sorting domain-containing protein [Flavobacterium nackdongense]QBN20081.1 T9SS type B sorting domain-containing protein [Flavobacterium nackdongense]